MAVGVLRELREQGLRVPQDVSVTGFDNIKLSEFCYPALTTVHIPRDRIGHIAFENLTPDPDNRRSDGREIVIDPEFLVRDSTGPPSRT
jgi:DNA-binding LacI/PurR family transcriptional regulator